MKLILSVAFGFVLGLALTLMGYGLETPVFGRY